MNQVINICLIGLNKGGRVYCDYAAGIFVQSALLVGVLLVADLFLRTRVRAVFRYCVWMLVLVKLILPPTVCLPTGIGYWVGGRLPAASPGSDGVSQVIGFEPTSSNPSPRSRPSGGAPQALSPSSTTATDGPVTRTAVSLTPLTWQAILLLFWLVGVLAFAALLAQRVRFVKGLVALSHPAGQDLSCVLEQCRRQVGIRREITLRTSDTVSSPAVCGLLRPCVLIPSALLERLAPDGLKAILIHELAHIKRGDLWVTSVQTFLQVIYFYNPFVWLANSVIRRIREEAVDETVLVALGGRARDYSNTLIDIGEMAFWKADLGLRLVGVAESRKALQWRIKHMLTRPIPQSARVGALGTITIIVVAAVLLPMARAERANTNMPATPQTASVDTSEEVPPAAESNVFVDPETGIRFTKFKTLSGPSDVLQYGLGLSLSPNGKFLLRGVRVIPLDGSESFDLVDMPAGFFAFWSPDGKKVVFHGSGALWLLEVDPDSGRPAGSPRKLVDGGAFGPRIRWSPDSERIIFGRRPTQTGGSGTVWTIAITGGEPSPMADSFSVGLVSPDGKMVATSDSWGGMFNPTPDPLWVKSVTGGEPRKVNDDIRTKCVVWSADSEWLVVSNHNDDQGIRFVHVADGREMRVTTPGPSGSTLIEQPRQGRELLFHQAPYDAKGVVRVASVAGGSPAEIGWPNLSFEEDWAGHQLWTHDARSIIVEGTRGEDHWGFWDVPLDGKAPRPLAIDTPMCRDANMRLFSPDGSKLLLFMGGITGTWDLWTVPVSLSQMKSSGPAVKAFGGMVPPSRVVGSYVDTWSPDSRKLAFVHNWDIWVADADGKNVLQLTQTSERDGWPMWSPDGTMVAFFTQPPDRAPIGGQEATYLQIRVVPAAGGEVKTVAGHSLLARLRLPARWTWFPDGKELTAVSEDEGIIANFPIGGGDPRTIVPLKDLGIARASWVRWSPDGRALAFQGGAGPRGMKSYVYRPDGAKLQQLADEPVAPFYWSPDSQWVSYFVTQPVKTLPEAVLWEMDVEEAVTKLAK